MVARDKIYEGKAKILYKADNDNEIIQYFKDDTTAFNNQKMEVLDSKGVLNNAISAHIYTELSKHNIANSFIQKLNEREQLHKKVDIIPLEVIVRNYSAGSFAKMFKMDEGGKIPTLVELCLKDDNLGDPLISPNHAYCFNIATPEQIKFIEGQALKINNILTDIFKNIGIKLVDFKIEFGLDNQGNVILADEISPDSCRLWDVDTDEKLDKDRFRRNLGNVVESYKQIANRLGITI